MDVRHSCSTHISAIVAQLGPRVSYINDIRDLSFQTSEHITKFCFIDLPLSTINRLHLLGELNLPELVLCAKSSYVCPHPNLFRIGQ